MKISQVRADRAGHRCPGEDGCHPANPADAKTNQRAEGLLGVHVATAVLAEHAAQLCIAQRHQHQQHPAHAERQDRGRPRFFGQQPGEDENAGPDNGIQPQAEGVKDRELSRTPR